MIKLDKKHSGVFAAGVLFGTAGIKLLSSKDAKKVYTNCTAAVLRAKDCVMKIVSKVQENAEDIYAEAQQINEWNFPGWRCPRSQSLPCRRRLWRSSGRCRTPARVRP